MIHFSHSFIFLSIQGLILIGAFLAWPGMIKKIAAARKMESLDPLDIQKMIRLKWRYSAWILMAFMFFNFVNRINF